MTRFLGAANLSTAGIEPAFALIQALHPSLTLDSWRTFAMPLVDQHPLAPRGLIGIQNEAAYLCGLFAYRVEANLEYERAFVVDVIAALDVLDAKAVIRAMIEAVQSRAQRIGCRIIRIRVTRSQGWLARHLENNGLESDGQLMSLPVARSQQNA